MTDTNRARAEKIVKAWRMAEAGLQTWERLIDAIAAALAVREGHVRDAATRLFTDSHSVSRKVKRLVLEYEDGPVLKGPGWCKEAVVDQIEAALAAKGTPPC